MINVIELNQLDIDSATKSVDVDYSHNDWVLGLLHDFRKLYKTEHKAGDTRNKFFAKIEPLVRTLVDRGVKDPDEEQEEEMTCIKEQLDQLSIAQSRQPSPNATLEHTASDGSNPDL